MQVRRPAIVRIVLLAAWLSGLGAVGAGLVAGRSFYLTPLAERPRHRDYWELKPGGSRGLAYGMTGTSMLLLMHLYSVRRRVARLRGLGPLPIWLDFHILLGVIGSLFIVLHSSLKVGGLIAVSFWSMVAVALSGLLGRYLYLQIPRNRAGDALTLAELEREDSALAGQLRSSHGFSDEDLTRLAHIQPPPAARGAWRLLAALLLAELDPRPRRRLESLLRSRGGPPLAPAAARELLRLLGDKVRIQRRLRLWDELHGLFHHWHVIHKPFALVMYVFLAIHIGVAVVTGYGPSWGE